MWNYKLVPLNSVTDYKAGLTAFLSAEKYFRKFGLKSETGYIQKGFKNTKTLTFSDELSCCNIRP
jgi:hypothetical protein